jgi:hypothetical protein
MGDDVLWYRVPSWIMDQGVGVALELGGMENGRGVDAKKFPPSSYEGINTISTYIR